MNSKKQICRCILSFFSSYQISILSLVKLNLTELSKPYPNTHSITPLPTNMNGYCYRVVLHVNILPPPNIYYTKPQPVLTVNSNSPVIGWPSVLAGHLLLYHWWPRPTGCRLTAGHFEQVVAKCHRVDHLMLCADAK